MQIFLIDPNKRTREVLLARVQEALRKIQLKRVQLVDGDFDTLRQNAGSDPPSGILLGPGSYQTLEASVSRVRGFYPKTPLAVVLDNNIYASEALELRKFLAVRIMPLADLAQMAQFVIESSGQSSAVTSDGVQGIVAVAQLKGGVGASSLAAALGSCWARHERSVALVDLDDVNPHITQWANVGISPRRVLRELMERGSVPHNRVREIVSQVGSSSFVVVGQPELYRDSFHFKADVLEAPSSTEFIRSLLGSLQEQYDIVLIDCGRSWGLAQFALLPLAQRVLMVLDDDRTTVQRSLKNLQRFYRESDDPAEFDLSKWRFVLNAYTGRLVQPQDISSLFANSDLFDTEVEVQPVPFSLTGRDWYLTDGGPLTLYELGEEPVKHAIEDLAASLISFRQEARRGSGRFRSQLQKIVNFLS